MFLFLKMSKERFGLRKISLQATPHSLSVSSHSLPCRAVEPGGSQQSREGGEMRCTRKRIKTWQECSRQVNFLGQGWGRLGFPGGSDGKESTHNAEDPVLISGTFETTLFQHGASSRNSPSQCRCVHLTWSLVHINL